VNASKGQAGGPKGSNPKAGGKKPDAPKAGASKGAAAKGAAPTESAPKAAAKPAPKAEAKPVPKAAAPKADAPSAEATNGAQANETAAEKAARSVFKRRLIGRVKSDKMNKTVVVEVVRSKMDPVYKKYVRVRKSYKAHDEENAYKVGDRVEIIEHRPLSKLKRWKVVNLVERAVQE
jgi:small subunit ribosomal protein S17